MPKVTDSYYTTMFNKRRIDDIAKKLERSRSWVINKALEIGLPAIDAGLRNLDQRKDPANEPAA